MNSSRNSSRVEKPSGYRSYVFGVVLVVLGLLVYLWGHVRTVQQGDELTRLRAEYQVLTRQQDRMRAELAGLKQSSRIRKIASQQLGMVFPQGPPHNLYLKEGSTAGLGQKN
ncbi:MAG: cell division protein FtsL [bacterium]|nr:cell division protein FtsL [bacterium]